MARGMIVGFMGTLGTGLAQLIVVDETERLTRINCEAGPTCRALQAAFDDQILGQEILYGLDELGLLKGFTPIEGVTT